MRSSIRIALTTTLLLMAAGCISTPQTKALITPVGALGYHTFRPPQAQPPTPSEIDRMVARINQDISRKDERGP